jgi:hypothetical protein
MWHKVQHKFQILKTNHEAWAIMNIKVANDKADEEEDVCRICWNPGYGGSPLQYPCVCNGSIKYMHQYCLL